MKLNLPEFDIKIKKKNNKDYIFDIIRKKYILLTPEEWVRQNLIHYLVKILNYPAQLLGVEKQINVFNTIKRPDIIVFDKKLQPIIIVECKNNKIKITQQTFNQAVNYYLELRPKYFILSNGINHLCCKIEDNNCIFLKEIPNFSDL
ncbi:MAG: type I restriction enzyme HsdR N-terminal domain-containing protein [Bacteroidales bacterium]|nr:type I restriction enzyme HsdR N-terminal domain-containing protein [Bacteroidales bacterium]